MAANVSGSECVTAYLQGAINVPFGVMQKARLTATQIFADIDVAFTLKESAPQPARRCVGIGVEFTSGMPAEFHAGALAYAQLFQESGTRIYVFTDRVARTAMQDEGAVLGHVIAHEVGHVLQGINRHSPEGVMKGNWVARDFNHMRVRPLHFTPADVDLIHWGVAKSREIALRMEHGE